MINYNILDFPWANAGTRRRASTERCSKVASGFHAASLTARSVGDFLSFKQLVRRLQPHPIFGDKIIFGLFVDFCKGSGSYLLLVLYQIYSQRGNIQYGFMVQGAIYVSKLIYRGLSGPCGILTCVDTDKRVASVKCGERPAAVTIATRGDANGSGCARRWKTPYHSAKRDGAAVQRSRQMDFSSDLVRHHISDIDDMYSFDHYIVIDLQELL